MAIVRKMREAPGDSTAQFVLTDDAAGKMDTYVSLASTSTAGLAKLAGNLSGSSTVPTVLRGDPWAYATGGADEVFSDDFTAFSGWSVCDALNPTNAQAYDSTVSTFRALSANPAIDTTTKYSSLLIQPDHNSGGAITIYKNIAGSVTFSGTWTIVGKVSLCSDFFMGTNGISLGLSAPSATDMRYDCVQLTAMAVSGTATTQGMYSRTGGGGFSTIATYTASEPLMKVSTIWWMLAHNNGSTNIYGFFSYDGKIWSEFGYGAKDPASFTTFWFYCFYTKHASAYTYGIIDWDYIRVYNTAKLR